MSEAPEWMKQKKAEIDLVDAQRQAHEARQRAELLLIEKLKPEFWENLKRELAVIADNLHLLNLKGAFTLDNFGGCKFELKRPGGITMVYANLFLDQYCIRCTTLNAGSFNLHFCSFSSSEIAVYDERNGLTPMVASSAAQYIFQKLSKALEISGGW